MTLDFNNTVQLDSDSSAVTINYTTNSKGVLMLRVIANGSTAGVIQVNGKTVYHLAANTATSVETVNIYGIDAGDVITSTVAVSTHTFARICNFVPYKTN